MAKFTVQQAADVLAVQQVINDWAYDLDLHNNEHVGDVITDDISYNIAGALRSGKAAVEAFYGERREMLAAKGGTPPVMRHINSNFRVSFNTPDHVSVTFFLVFFSTEVVGFDPADVIAVADVWMDCKRDAEGEWRISKFDSMQPLIRKS